MKATLLAKTKEVRDDGSIVEVVIWQVAESVPPCSHLFKYRLYFGWLGKEMVRYDNERGKGDHRHVRGEELAYTFLSLEQLLEDFDKDIERWGSP